MIAELLAGAVSEPPRRRSGAGLVLSVAGIALAIGLAAGWVFMKRNELPHLRPLPSAVPPAHESAAPRTHSKAPEHAATAREEPSAAASVPLKPSPVVRAAPDEVAPAIVPVSKPTPPAAASAPSAAPDAGWVKPAWAIPDDEPVRVHVDDARDAGN